VLTKSQGARKSYDKQIKLNGLTVGSTKALRGRLVCVSFKSSDLNLLRGGPKDRRDWIDEILVTIRPSHHELLSKYQKIVLQRNRLLKQFFEKGRVSVSDHEQLQVWDEQLAQSGSTIIKRRLGLLHELLPYAERHQEHISGRRETLTAQYLFRAAEKDMGEGSDEPVEKAQTRALNELSEPEIASILLRLMKERRGEEIARKQSLCGPHRDDIQFFLNGEDAVEFASQGQQRSLVLSFKLAQLERVEEVLTEPPLLLLDDVLAELDLNRQGLLMSLVKEEMQTLITTTHVTGFRAEWVEGALFLEVAGGSISAAKETQAVI
jgi:DNA replication and repair protein RecF